MTTDVQKLECLLHKFNVFTKVMYKYQNEYDVISQRYKYFKKQYILPIKNNHYRNCPFSISCYEIKSNDFCSCYYGQIFIKNLCCEILELIGYEYMINF